MKPFSGDEAWKLFRLAAVGEAVGWALLLAGISIRHFRLPGAGIAVPIAGQIHGTLFLIYFGILLAVATSLRWRKMYILIALIVGIIPFGTLAFEQWMAYQRARRHRQALLLSAIRYITANT